MKSTHGFIVILMVAMTLSACRTDQVCADDPNLEKLEISFSDPWIFTPGNVAPLPATLQYPENCENGNPFGGQIRVSINNPNVVPGYQLVIRGDGREGPTWESPNATPANGRRSCELAALPIQGATPTPGNYEAELDIEFLAIADVANGVATDITRTVRIQVTDGAFFISIAQPNPNIQYPAEPAGGGNQYGIQVEADITSQNSPLTSVLYRLDELSWLAENGINSSSFNISEVLFLPDPWDGDHTLTIKAYNTLGDSAIQTSRFTIPMGGSGPGGGGGNASLNDHRWDGGGDGFNWHDPQNWEDDRLPTALDRAIVDLAGTDRVVVSKADVLDPTRVTYRVGALTVEANMEIRGPVTLLLEQAEPSQPVQPIRSGINGSLRYSLTQLANTRPRFEYHSRGARHELTIEDTVYVNGVFFQQTSDAGIQAPLHVILNGPGGNFDGSPFVSVALRGDVHFELKGEIDLPGSSLSISMLEEGIHTPTFINRGNITLENGGGFSGDDKFNLSTFINEGEITVNRTEPDSRLSFWNIDFVESGNTAGFIVDTTNDVVDTARQVFFTDCSGTVENLFTRGRIQLRSNDVIFRNTRCNELIMEKSDEFSAIEPVFTIHGDQRDMGRIIIWDGEVQTQPGIGNGTPLRLEELIVSSDDYLRMGNPNLPGQHLEIEKLTLRGRVLMASNDTLRLGQLLWFDGGFNNDVESWIYLKPHPQGRASTINAGHLNFLSLESNVRLESGAEINYRDGKIIFIDQEKRTYVHIEPNAVFRFNNELDDIDWSLPLDGSHDGWVQIDNEGTIIKEYQTTVSIQGCLDNIGGGTVDVQGGVLDFVQLLNPSLNCN